MTDPIADLKGSPYGGLVYDAALTVLEDSRLAPLLSDPTAVQVGSWLTGVYTIATSGGDTQQIVESSVELGLEMAINLAAELAPAIGEVIPIVGQMFKIAFAALDVMRATADAKAQQALANAQAAHQKAAAEALSFRPMGTGPAGSTMPADLFVQVRTSPRPIIETGRVPAVGLMLQAMTEVMWPIGLVQRTSAPLVGIPVDIARSLNPPAKWKWGDPMFPAIARYAPVMSQLRIAIEQQQITRRDVSDQGNALWPLYMDLLYALLYLPQFPWDLEPATAAAAGYTAAPLIDARFTGAMFGGHPLGPAQDPQFVKGYPWQMPPILYYAQHDEGQPDLAGIRLKLTDQQRELARLAQPGRGDWAGSVDAIYKMAYDWDLSVRPLNFRDQAELSQSLEVGLQQIEAMMRGELAARGLTDKTSSRLRGGALIQRAVNARLVSDVAAERAAQKAGQGMAVATSLALGALSWYLGR